MNGVETRREAERLISEYRNATSTRDKISRIHAFNKLWKSASSEGDNPSRKLRGMLHIGLLPLIMESLTSRELVTVETVQLQALMLTALERFLRFCSQETPNPWPTHFSQFEASVPEVFVCSFKMIEEKIQERYIIPLQVGLLTTFLMVSEFFGNLVGNPQIIKRIDISKILDTLWASGFANMNPTQGASSTRSSLFLGNYPRIVFVLEKLVPSWDQTYRPASLTRAIARYGPERIADRIKEVCEDPQTPAKAINLKTIGAMIGLFMGNRAVAVETIKAGFSKTLIRVYWAWLRQTDEKREGPEAGLTKMVFQSICFLLQFSSKTAGHEALLKTTVQDLLDEDFMMIVGKVLVVAQYEEDFVRIESNVLKELFERVFKQVYGAKCEDRELWHSYSHVLNCARAYCRVHGDPPAWRRSPIYEYRAVTHLWHSLGMSIGVGENIWWNEFVWCKLPREVRKMGCNWIKCPVFGMDYLDTLTAGPTPLVCSKCREVFYCSMECQKQDWNQGTHRRQCLGKELSVPPSREGTIKASP